MLSGIAQKLIRKISAGGMGDAFHVEDTEFYNKVLLSGSSLGLFRTPNISRK